jgi:dUTPase
MNFNIKKLHEDATIPMYGSAYAAGLDINSYIDI